MAGSTNSSPLPFLWDDTNATNGLWTSAITVMTTELDSKANAAVAASSVNGNSGVFPNTFFGQAIWADIFYMIGSPGMTGTLQAGACISGWFLTTPDQSTYESVTVAPPRPPDFIIPLPSATSLAASSFFAARNIMLPALEFKLLVQNNTGQTLSTGGTTAPYIKIAPIAMQY